MEITQDVRSNRVYNHRPRARSISSNTGRTRHRPRVVGSIETETVRVQACMVYLSCASFSSLFSVPVSGLSLELIIFEGHRLMLDDGNCV